MYKTRHRMKLIANEMDLNIRINNKNSFEKFGDDLSELLLSFLAFDDKLRYECVSKQWKSLIFNKHNKIDFKFSNNFSNKSMDVLLQNLLYRSHNHYNYFFKINETYFRVILTKFEFIKEIRFSSEILINTRILQMIGNYCKYLEKIIINRKGFEDIKEKQIQRFGQKCGKKLKLINFLNTISFQSKERLKTLYEFTPNIESFYFDDISIITSKPINYFSKLEKVIFGRNLMPIKGFTIFADYYCKQIKEINLSFDHLMSSDTSEDVKKEEFLQLSRFEKLEILELIVNDININCFDVEKGLLMMGKKCKHLWKFCFTVYVENATNFTAINNSFFKILSAFQSIIKCEFTVDYEGNEVELNYNSIETPNCMQNMKHLKLEIPQLNDKHFENLSAFLPNLKTLKIFTENSEISDKSFHNFAKLQNVTHIRLENNIYELEDVPNGEEVIRITDIGVKDVVKCCPYIRRIDVSDCFCRITDQTIDAIMSLKLNPKIEYYFYFDDNTDGALEKYIKSVEKYLPNNLKFESFQSEF